MIYVTLAVVLKTCIADAGISAIVSGSGGDPDIIHLIVLEKNSEGWSYKLQSAHKSSRHLECHGAGNGQLHTETARLLLLCLIGVIQALFG
jgi:hypothetical protein